MLCYVQHNEHCTEHNVQQPVYLQLVHCAETSVLSLYSVQQLVFVLCAATCALCTVQCAATWPSPVVGFATACWTEWVTHWSFDLPCTLCMFLLFVVFSADAGLCLSPAISFSTGTWNSPAPGTIECDTGHLCVPRQAMLIRHVAHLNEPVGGSSNVRGGTRDHQTKLPEITQWYYDNLDLDQRILSLFEHDRHFPFTAKCVVFRWVQV